ncbi:hypothetical protein N9L19_00600 [bacterium]|nr:hypothetical protein [bacterium]
MTYPCFNIEEPSHYSEAELLAGGFAMDVYRKLEVCTRHVIFFSNSARRYATFTGPCYTLVWTHHYLMYIAVGLQAPTQYGLCNGQAK